MSDAVTSDSKTVTIRIANAPGIAESSMALVLAGLMAAVGTGLMAVRQRGRHLRIG